MNAELALFDALKKPLGPHEQVSILLESISRIQEGMDSIIRTAETERIDLEHMNGEYLIERAGEVAKRVQSLVEKIQKGPRLIRRENPEPSISGNLAEIESIEMPLMENIEVRQLYLTHLKIQKILHERGITRAK